MLKVRLFKVQPSIGKHFIPAQSRTASVSVPLGIISYLIQMKPGELSQASFFAGELGTAFSAGARSVFNIRRRADSRLHETCTSE